MDTQRWNTIRELYETLVDQPPERQHRLLEQACEGDDALRREVLSLLAFDGRAGEFLEPPALLAPGDFACLTGEQTPGARLGEFTILGVLGRGGMSIVYDAEQDSPRRRVALKVLRIAPFMDEVTLRLFHREAQVLARLDHAGIAGIYGAGTENGCHYFAMERIDGSAVIEHARARRLSVAEKLSLFCRVADAVHYAHQRGVLHRDLKPSNILVAPSGQPKILDFGLARIIDTEAALKETRTGTVMGTLAYMSPEQVRGHSVEIDVRSDVYSLGVILYELLTGQNPSNVAGASLPEAARLICEQPPVAPGVHQRQLRGDMSTVMLKALDKHPDQRYASVAALGDDVRRILAKQPILARPPSTIYQLHKLIVRHRVVSILVAALLVTLIGFGAWMSVLYGRAERLRQQAVAGREAALTARDAERVARENTEAQKQRAIFSLTALTSLLAEQQPSRRRGEPFDPVQFLLRVDKWASEDLNDFPRDQFDLRCRLTSGLSDLDEYEAAPEIAQRNRATAVDRFGGDSPEAREASVSEAMILLVLGRTQRALQVVQNHVDELMAESRAGSNRRVINNFRRLWPQLLQRLGRNEEALEAARTLLAHFESDTTPDAHSARMDLNHLLGALYLQSGRLEEGLPYARQAFEARLAKLGPDSTETLRSQENFAICLSPTDKTRSVELLTDALTRVERIQGADSVAAGLLHRNLGSLIDDDDLAEAVRHARRAAEIFGARLPESHPLRQHAEALVKELEGKKAE